MKKKTIGFLICILIFISVFTIPVSADSGPELKITISDYYGSVNPIIRYSHGVQIENIGYEDAIGIAVDFWISGGIFSKTRQLLKITDSWSYGCGKIKSGEKTYCPIYLNLLYLGNIELTAKVWADNAEPVTESINAFASIGLIWVYSEN